MKKIFSMLVITAMAAMMLSAGASAATTNTVVSGNGICAIVVKCEAGNNDITCDDSQNSAPEIICPAPDTDAPSDDNSNINPPEQDENAPSDDNSNIIYPEQDTNPPSDDNSGTTAPEQDTNAPSADSDMHGFETEVIRLVNEIRAENGLNALTADKELSRVARIKSQDMKDNKYFSHTSPTYGSPFEMMNKFGISYKSAGENIARGQSTPAAVVNAWMNSDGHRANILNASYNTIGVGYVADGNYWTQMFIQR